MSKTMNFQNRLLRKVFVLYRVAGRPLRASRLQYSIIVRLRSFLNEDGCDGFSEKHNKDIATCIRNGHILELLRLEISFS